MQGPLRCPRAQGGAPFCSQVKPSTWNSQRLGSFHLLCICFSPLVLLKGCLNGV